MGKQDKIRIVETDLLEYPAFLAWRELRLGSAKPERIEILKGKTPNQNHRLKRFVCRLVGVGPEGVSVIGKRCQRPKAEIENTIYKEILPNLSIHSLNYFGIVAEANDEFSWLFLEDAGDDTYSALLEEHRLLGAQWLALMHTSAPNIGQPDKLPDKGLIHYLKRLRKVRETLIHIIKRYMIQSDDLVHMEAIITKCDFLEAHWDKVEDLYQGLPQMIVHGDFVSKNLRVHSNHDENTFLPFDWGEAGWGPPAIDIIHVEPFAYWSNVRGSWSWLSLQDILSSAEVGKIFRSIDAIYWELSGFGFTKDVLNNNLSNMRIYNSWLTKAIEVARLMD
jgi:hypothetical protein